MTSKLISVREEVKQALDKLKVGDESYGSVIARLLEERKK